MDGQKLLNRAETLKADIDEIAQMNPISAVAKIREAVQRQAALNVVICRKIAEIEGGQHGAR